MESAPSLSFVMKALLEGRPLSDDDKQRGLKRMRAMVDEVERAEKSLAVAKRTPPADLRLHALQNYMDFIQHFVPAHLDDTGKFVPDRRTARSQRLYHKGSNLLLVARAPGVCVVDTTTKIMRFTCNDRLITLGTAFGKGYMAERHAYNAGLSFLPVDPKPEVYEVVGGDVVIHFGHVGRTFVLGKRKSRHNKHFDWINGLELVHPRDAAMELLFCWWVHKRFSWSAGSHIVGRLPVDVVKNIFSKVLRA